MIFKRFFPKDIAELLHFVNNNIVVKIYIKDNSGEEIVFNVGNISNVDLISKKCMLGVDYHKPLSQRYQNYTGINISENYLLDCAFLGLK